MENIIRIWKNKGKILEGILNSIFKKEHVEEIAMYRYEICTSCNYIDRTGATCAVPGTSPCCSLCGCSLSLKTRSLSSECDDKRWFAELSIEEEDLLNDNLGLV